MYKRQGLQDVVGFRWDKADLAMYYRLTGEQLYDIDISHDLLSNDNTIDEAVILPVLDGFYRAIVSGLFNASVYALYHGYGTAFINFGGMRNYRCLKIILSELTNCGPLLAINLALVTFFVPCNRLNMSISQLLRLRKSRAKSSSLMS